MLSNKEKRALDAIKKYFIDECKIPSSIVLSRLIDMPCRDALYTLQALEATGILRKNKLGGLRFSRFPAEIIVIK